MAEETDRIIHELESSVFKKRRLEYTVLISKAKFIKADLTTVEAKVSVLCLSVVYKSKPKEAHRTQSMWLLVLEVWQIVL